MLENKKPELMGHGGTVPTLPGVAEKAGPLGGNRQPLGSQMPLGPNERKGD